MPIDNILNLKIMENLTEKELIEISGGETGWYYLGKAVGEVDVFLGKLFFSNEIIHWR
jgi:bacteriocin-like protein